ncbi:BTAD domain-containing putative transcriptional regulator [Cognatiyoonia sp. IB215182]|uniref:BTAD domain-containing putative transcriptional regulator n=1 Tax=Cognatiyoonia sp. IB215182 TaxID=3097353 RepID=UPI002A24730E|nr:BTAD domain-containing putative transcriptional regulator [Cognatiyoonia sp. IB215182]
MSIKLDILRRSPSVKLDGCLVRTNSQRGDALLAYLCLSGETTHSRDSLACLLWEDADPTKSKGSLRQIIRKLRQAAPGIDDIIEFGRSQVSVKKKAITTDLDTLSHALETGELANLPANYDQKVEDFMADFTGLSGALDSWLSVIRNQVDFTLRDTFTRAISDPAVPGTVRDHAARCLQHFDPTNEPACRHLMREHWAMGDTASALALYRDLYEALGEEHDSEPSEETQALVVRIQMGDEPQTASTIPKEPELPVICVAEMDLSDLDATSQKVVRVLRHELFAGLSSFREWQLFDSEPRSPAFYRLELQAADDGENVFLIATLKLRPDERIIWSERFDIRFDTWDPVQRLIAKRLALAVNTRVNLDRLNQRRRVEFQNQELFDDWVLAQSLILDWDVSKNQIAIDLLDGILRVAPEFASARSSRANAESIYHLNRPGVYLDKAKIELALFHARKAVQVDPLDTRSQLALGWALAMDGQSEASLLHMETCRELNPCSSLGSLACALGMAFAGDTARASAMVDETLSMTSSIAPYLWGYIQNIHYLSRNLEGAIEAGHKAGASIANLPGWHAAALWEAGQTQEATLVAGEFLAAARRKWVSPAPFNAEALCEWLVACFPLSPKEQSARLATSLNAALARV